MATMIRGNCEITVAEHLVGEYLSKGYSLLDAQGKVVQQADPQNIGDFKNLVKRQQDKIVELTAERDELFRLNTELTEKLAALEKQQDEDNAQEKQPDAKPPKSTAKK